MEDVKWPDFLLKWNDSPSRLRVISIAVSVPGPRPSSAAVLLSWPRPPPSLTRPLAASPGPSQSQQPATRTRLQQPDMQHIDTTSMYAIFGTLVTGSLLTRPTIAVSRTSVPNVFSCLGTFYTYHWVFLRTNCSCHSINVRINSRTHTQQPVMCERQCPHCTECPVLTVFWVLAVASREQWHPANNGGRRRQDSRTLQESAAQYSVTRSPNTGINYSLDCLVTPLIISSWPLCAVHWFSDKVLVANLKLLVNVNLFGRKS